MANVNIFVRDLYLLPFSPEIFSCTIGQEKKYSSKSEHFLELENLNTGRFFLIFILTILIYYIITVEIPSQTQAVVVGNVSVTRIPQRLTEGLLGGPARCRTGTSQKFPLLSEVKLKN